MSVEHLKSLGIFAEVVAQGSFRGAARSLGMTPSAVTYHIQILEETIGAPLFYRSTRKLTLTEAGQHLRHPAQTLRDVAETGLQAASAGQAMLTGVLRIALTVSLVRSPISRALARFQRDHPKVALELTYSDMARDLVADRVDLALRAGGLTDSNLRCTRVWSMPRVIVAAPDFLDHHGAPTSPDELARLPWVKHANLSTRRSLTHPSHGTVEIEQAGTLSVDNIEAMVDLACEGMAIASPPRHYVADHLARGTLVEVLGDWQLPEIPVHALWPASKVENPLTKAFLATLTDIKKRPIG
jgi:DNA-binding transcriptional LysR family regulator